MAIRVLLAVAMLIPVWFLYDAAAGSAANREQSANREQLGLDYVRALEPFTAALVVVQSAVVAGESPPMNALTDAITGVRAIDARAGVALGVADRWQALQTRLQRLSRQGEPAGLYQSYSEVNDLMLALYLRIQQTSGLSADPQPDILNLQNALVIDLPRITVGIGRYADLAQLAKDKPTEVNTLAQVLAQLQAATVPGDDLINSIETAVATTASTSLSSAVFAGLDTVRSRLDSADSASRLITSEFTAANAKTAGTVSNDLIVSNAALSKKLLVAMDDLLKQRHDSARSDQQLALYGLLGAIALIVVAIVLAVLEWTRNLRAAAVADEPPAEAGSPPARSVISHALADRAMERSGATR